MGKSTGKEVYFIHFPGIRKKVKEIDRDRYVELSKARQGIIALQQIEEYFNLILKSYEEFEQELLSINLREITSPKDEMSKDIASEKWSYDMESLYLLNLRLTSFLVTSISYREVLKGKLSSLLEKTSKEFIELKNKIEKDLSEEWIFQLMIILRNINVHQGKLINTITKRQTKVETGKGLWKRTIHLKISIDEIFASSRQIQDFNLLQEKLSELREQNDSLELIPLLRMHMDLIGNFHKDMRKIVSEKTREIDQLIFDALNTNNDFLYLKRATEEDGITEQLTVFIDPINRRRSLITKNHVLHRFSIQFVSGESPKLD